MFLIIEEYTLTCGFKYKSSNSSWDTALLLLELDFDDLGRNKKHPWNWNKSKELINVVLADYKCFTVVNLDDKQPPLFLMKVIYWLQKSRLACFTVGLIELNKIYFRLFPLLSLNYYGVFKT